MNDDGGVGGVVVVVPAANANAAATTSVASGRRRRARSSSSPSSSSSSSSSDYDDDGGGRRRRAHDEDEDEDEDGASAIAAPGRSSVDGRRGILIVGREGHDAYAPADDRRRIVDISPGDAIAFYSYDADGARDMRSIHSSLTSTEEKWISTCWFRSGGLTGPFGSLRKARLLDEWTTREEAREEAREEGRRASPPVLIP
jgi:hypothetical protein